MSLARKMGGRLVPHVTRLAPDVTAAFVQQALHRAIVGAAKLPGAADAARKLLQEHHGDVDRAIKEAIEKHLRYAGAEGFLTNLGGLATMAVTVPANLSGLAIIECRLVAVILHLRGYDLDDPRSRAAILATLLGEDRMASLIKRKLLPGTPMAIATAPVYDEHLAHVLANEVAADLVARVAGRRLALTVGRRVPVVGGVVGAGTDGFATWRIGRYAEREFLPRARR